ncbi:Gfo/Idh/MocA family oxidoreductase [Marinobacterium sp. D7]|uniref:Gfo/Idh/MocA family protein n=1 Tax=Marinobacterium ramblicola TaxID=2849041 RepID=UPI001C2DD8DA|nr:Gfo/Idh/MocA family oxidoreductase [Marinobacterium ramblicola]MBV1787672.1 Gfo/Idh/MocA family oxidoreductase [Marinobacterium ramblicola]
MAETIRWGMVGGGIGGFIGEVHRMAARLDGGFVLQAGCFSSDMERNRLSGIELGIAPGRTYDSFEEMAVREAARSDGIRAVSIVTPNHLHFAAAKAFLEAGIDVICDKPLTTTLAEAKVLAQIAQERDRLLAATYNYTGNAMIRWARQLVSEGALGSLRLVQVEYAQDWLARDIEQQGQKQAAWRTNPELAGRAGCLGDIGVHAYNLARFVTGRSAGRVQADLTRFVPGRQVDDNAQVMLDFGDGLRGALWASQVAVGSENTLRLRLYGENASLAWEQEHPNQLQFTRFGEPPQVFSRNSAGYPAALQHLCRVPAGHPEGYLEAFANIYGEIRAALQTGSGDYPGVDVAVADLAFIEACLESDEAENRWRPVPQ